MLAVDATARSFTVQSLSIQCTCAPTSLFVNEFTNVARVNCALGRSDASWAIITRLMLAANEEIQTYERHTHVSGGACADW